MKLSFSTLGCPDWSWSEIFAVAGDLNFDGIELRGVGDTLDVTKADPFLPEHIDKTVEKLKKSGLEVPILSTGTVLGKGDKKGLEEVFAYCNLAYKLGAKYVRVLAGESTNINESVNLTVLLEEIDFVCKRAKECGVTILIETYSAFTKGEALAKLIKSANQDNLGALWDVHHPYRYANELPEQTIAALGEYICHVHVKDSIIQDGKVAYKMMGYGDLPLSDCIKALNSINYKGYISLEWVRRWNPDLTEAGVVFSHFYGYMSRFGI